MVSQFKERRTYHDELQISGGVGICEDSSFIIERKMGDQALKCVHKDTQDRYIVKVVSCMTNKNIPNKEDRQKANEKIYAKVAREYEMACRSEHPNVAQYYGYGQD
jgi:hypothetical protein